MSKVLIVIDMQNDFLTGALANPAGVEALPRVRDQIVQAMNRDDTIIYTRDTHFDDYLNTHEGKYLPVPHCIINTKGWEIEDSVAYPEYFRAYTINKETFGTLEWERYRDIIEAADEILICGLVSSICVVSNALILRAMFPEKDISFLSEASAGLAPEDHAAACTIMKCNHINIK